ncbi:MAG TPA: hypothetical protein VHY22_18545 [Chthoniobacteraceae bacterium]|jgi:hypothetical protein|nr:hypothetical protein [Chthoniobacteraceae bacterium]
MTAPGTSEARIEPHEEEVVLRLGDILPRVPAHLLKPGPHDRMKQLRFSVDELAEKISRGRASVPVERLAAACPEIFITMEGLGTEPEIPLPLQKLLEQVGLIAPKPPAPNGVPQEQVKQARVEATRIIDAEAVRPEPEAAKPAAEPEKTPEREKTAKLVSPARRLLGLFTKAIVNKSQLSGDKDVANHSTEITGNKSEAVLTSRPVNKSPDPVSAPAIPPGCISLRVLPILRLLPAEAVRFESLPPEDTRVALPLSVIDPQLAAGHVEIPLEDFIKALPENAKTAVVPKEGINAWIPLDEIFQSLPPDHLFYMPPYEPVKEPAAPESNSPPEDAASRDNIHGAKDPTSPPASAGEKAASASTEKVAPETVEPSQGEAAPQGKTEPLPVEATTAHAPKDKPAEPAPEPETADSATAQNQPKAPAPPQEPAPASEPVASEPVASEPVASEPVASESPAAAAPAPEPPSKTPAPAPQPSPAEPAETQTSRAPWMRGFQVPPPRLFHPDAAAEASPAAPEFNSTANSAPVEPLPAAAPTPEARRTADFLASQPGIFAAAAFVEGAVFASADFPRKPDLDALRDFVGNIVGLARESGRQLGWSHQLTIACDQFHATAAVRDTHFIVALHHDRTLPPLAHEALVGAADDLSNGTAPPDAAPPVE